MSVEIHPTAVVSPKAELGENVKVMPYATIEDQVVIGDNTIIEAQVNIGHHTTMGKDNHVYPHASIGTDPQDISYKGEETHLVIGDSNIFREFITVNRGTPDSLGVTTIGKECMLMAYSHVAHDCTLGDHVIMANMATLGGHVEVGDYVIISGMVAVHQFCRLGAHSFIGGVSGVTHDVLPYCIADGRRTTIRSPNLVGLKRRGFPNDSLTAIKEAYMTLFKNGEGVFADRVDRLEEKLGQVPEVRLMIDFIRSSKRGVCH